MITFLDLIYADSDRNSKPFEHILLVKFDEAKVRRKKRRISFSTEWQPLCNHCHYKRSIDKADILSCNRFNWSNKKAVGGS